MFHGIQSQYHVIYAISHAAHKLPGAYLGGLAWNWSRKTARSRNNVLLITRLGTLPDMEDNGDAVNGRQYGA